MTTHDDLTRDRARTFREAVEGFTAGAGLRRFHPVAWPVGLAWFGRARHWRNGRPLTDGPALDYFDLDHGRLLALPTGRLAAAIAWPYADTADLRAWAGRLFTDPRFVFGVDDPPGGVDRGPAGVYGRSSARGWIVADTATLGEARALALVAAFTSGGYGLAAAVAEQQRHDAREAALRTAVGSAR